MTGEQERRKSPGRPKEIGDDWYRVESWFPPDLYAEIRAWVEVRRELAIRAGESASKISIRTELSRAWARFFETLPAETREEVRRHPQFRKFSPDDPPQGSS